ncbi:MAG TPA: hypothetical protein VII11_01060 [Bacteroidota bacterium]
MSVGAKPGNLPITIRELTTFEEYDECIAIQKEAWGDEFEEWVPTSVLKVSQKIGGIVAGAYDERQRMLGFVYGLSGVKDGKPVHWSHMLAVRNDARGLGLGKKLKFYQRDLLLQRGIDVVYWTFDPLVARNANLNFNGLGAQAAEYVKDMYKESSSILHRGVSMDRFVVEWRLESDRVKKALSNQPSFKSDRYAQAPVVNTQQQGTNTVKPVELPLPLERVIRVEIPFDIDAMKANSMALAAEWRANTRRVFLWYQEHRYTIDGFYIDRSTQRCYYCLTQEHESHT